MLRHQSLQPLSRQHHNGLALGVLARRSLQADSSKANVRKWCQKAVERFDLELVNHFEAEEQILFPAITAELGGHPEVAALLSEHSELKRLSDLLRTTPDRAVLESFLALLASHIRREESVLFEDIQHRMTAEQLAALGAPILEKAVEICLEP